MSPVRVECPTVDVVQLKIPGQPQYIGIVRLALSGLAARFDLPFDEAEDLKLAVTEACSHLLRNCSARVDLNISFECTGEVVSISVRSAPVRPATTCQPTLPEQPPGTMENGEPDLGIYLIEALVDRVDMCEAEDGTVRSVTMSKRLARSVGSDL